MSKTFCSASLNIVASIMLAILSASPVYASDSKDKIYTVGIVPQFEVRKLHQIWRPILDELERRTGYHFRIQGSPTIPDFEGEFMLGAFDFAYMNPYHIMLANEQVGYVPLVRDVGRTLHGVLVTRKDSGLDEINDLDGKILAFPSPNALGASLQMRQELSDKFNIKIKPRYVKTHDSVYLAVALNQASAGGGVQKTLARQKPEIQSLLRVLHRTTPVSPHPFAAHPRVPEDVRKRVSQALLDIGATDDGRHLLSLIPIKQIGVASMEDYQPLAELGLERFYKSSN